MAGRGSELPTLPLQHRMRLVAVVPSRASSDKLKPSHLQRDRSVSVRAVRMMVDVPCSKISLRVGVFLVRAMMLKSHED